MATVLAGRRAGPATGNLLLTQFTWFVIGAVGAFLVPYIFTSVFDIDHQLYYGIYFAFAALFLASYALETKADILGLFTRRWRWSLAIGALAAAFVVWNVLANEDSTAHPGGLFFAFTIAWRGLLYGIVDALMLTAFPVAVTWALFEGRLGSWTRRIEFGAAAFALIFVMTAVYHLGYEQYRDDGIAQPEVGNTIISLPALLSTNPLGSVIAHASMHITADTHAYETETFLPPATSAD